VKKKEGEDKKVTTRKGLLQETSTQMDHKNNAATTN
jgi:hypothetical protein